MIKIETRYYAYLREVTGKSSEIIMLDKRPTINDVLKLIVDKYGEQMRKYVFDEKEEIRSNVTIAINARKISRDSIKNYLLNNGDVLVIIPPISGGIIS